MTVKEYMNEIELIKKQNNTEYDLYFVIAPLLKKRKCIGNDLSLRAVFNRRRSAKGQVFYGLSNMPDFVILDLDFDNEENVNQCIDNIDQAYGCVEVKRLNETLLDINNIKDKIKKKQKISVDEGQLLGDILWYKKVLYTNGYEWKYYEWDAQKEEFEYIIKIVRKRIDSKDKDFKWYKKIDFNRIDFNNIHEKFNISNLRNLEEGKSDDLKKWDEFIEELDKIQWKFCE